MAGRDMILVIGVGNDFRRDDGVGPSLAQEIRKQNFSNVRVFVEWGEGVQLMAAWEGFQHVILIDAVRSGREPGTVHRFEAHREAIPKGFFNYSSHAFSVAEAIEMARVLGQLPPYFVIFGVEGGDFAQGTGFSPEVQQGMKTVLEMVEEEINVISEQLGRDSHV